MELFGILFVSIYLSSLLLVAHRSDAPRRWLVVMGDGSRIQNETTDSSNWFFNPLPNDFAFWLIKDI